MFGAKGNLSPAQRAGLKFAETLIWGALLAGFQAAGPLLSNPDVSRVAWASVLHTFGAAFLLAVMLGVSKYHTAQADPPLPEPSAPSAPAVAAPVADPAAVPVAAVVAVPALPLESNV